LLHARSIFKVGACEITTGAYFVLFELPEDEIQQIRLPVDELYAQLSTGSIPGPLGLPDVGVDIC
jgi:hypothetical protein